MMYNRFSQELLENGDRLEHQSADQLLLTIIAALLLKENYSHTEILTILSIIEAGE